LKGLTAIFKMIVPNNVLKFGFIFRTSEFRHPSLANGEFLIAKHIHDATKKKNLKLRHFLQKSKIYQRKQKFNLPNMDKNFKKYPKWAKN
jgi:hypothetical protein